MSSVAKLHLLGQSIWYDNLQRSLIEDGTLKDKIERREIFGVTSNPSIFQKAIAKSQDYDADLQTMAWADLSSEQIFYRLAIQDIQNLADLFLPYYHASSGADGFVSLEVNPHLANDTQGTINEVRWLWEMVNRPNLMVKIPATKAGLPAITEAIAAGVNVNVTLIFSRKRYEEVMSAYLDGLEKRMAAGKEIDGIASVASFFVSRLETKADQMLQTVIDGGGARAEIAKSLKGKLAVENTRLAYQLYKTVFNSERFKALAKNGAQKQRPLWASTSTKDEAYSDIKYVSELVAENSVNTVPPETLEAFLDHGEPELTIERGLDRAEVDFRLLSDLGISIDNITQELEDEGVQQFMDAFDSLLKTIDARKEQFQKEIAALSDVVPLEVETLKSADVVGRIFRSDPTVWTDSAEQKSEIQKRLGWLNLPTESAFLILSLEEFAADCRKDGMEQVLLLGMGGSSLAPETMNLILGEQANGMAFKILDSTIPAQVKEAEAWVDFEKTLFIVASKSGTTSETMSMFHYFWAKTEALVGETCGSHFVAITDPGSSLAALGEEKQFRAVFTANPNVGGRYSALTHFGLVPAALMGIDLDVFLNSAQVEAEHSLPLRDLELNLAVLLGILAGQGAINGKDKLTFIADDRLAPLGPWLEQLVAESSGKNGKGIVPIADEPLGDPARYGDDRLFVYLCHDRQHESFVSDLIQNGQPVVRLEVPDLYSLAGQFYRWELAVAIACSQIGVNAFDQPDVQDNKNRTKEKIAAFKQSGSLAEPEVLWEKDGIQIFGEEFDGLAQCKTLFDVLDAFAGLSRQGDYIAINAYVPRNATTLDNLTHLRKRLLESTGRATTLGFGPRFLHSTGQLHKGGGDNGVFIQLTQQDQMDLDIPGEGFGFGVLARAQAQGDLEALLSRGRHAIRVHLPVDHLLQFD